MDYWQLRNNYRGYTEPFEQIARTHFTSDFGNGTEVINRETILLHLTYHWFPPCLCPGESEPGVNITTSQMINQLLSWFSLGLASGRAQLYWKRRSGFDLWLVFSQVAISAPEYDWPGTVKKVVYSADFDLRCLTKQMSALNMLLHSVAWVGPKRVFGQVAPSHWLCEG